MKAGTWRQLEDHHWRQFIVGVAQGSNPLLDTRHVSPSNLPCFMLDHYSESCQTRIHDTVALPCFNINFTGASPVWRGGTRPSLARRNGIPPLVPIVVTHVVKRCASPIPHFNSVFHKKHHIHCFNTRHYCTLEVSCVRPANLKTLVARPRGFHAGSIAAAIWRRCCPDRLEYLHFPAINTSLRAHLGVAALYCRQCRIYVS